MAPATEKCRPSSLSEVNGSVDTTDDATRNDASEGPPPPPDSMDSSRCRCCGCWQHCCSRARSPRGTDKAGTSDKKETLLSGGKTRFYCCETKMTTRPARVGPNRARNPRNTLEQNPLQAAAVSSGLCSLFGRRDNSVSEEGTSPVDVAFDALTFDEQAYLEEFEHIHRENYDVSRTTRNPVVPHTETLLHPSQVGRVIIIKGRTHEGGQEFAVNLICRERRDIAMHFNPRLDRGYIARNTKLGGYWGLEENSLNGPSPFVVGAEFTIQILVAEDEYRFCHNGRHICSYRHRVPTARLQTLEVNGDVDLSLVKHEMVQEFPPPVPPVRVLDLLRDNHLLSIGHTALLIPTSHSWQENIPKQSFFFLGHFEPNVAIGREIIIGGYVRLLPHAFFINLQDGLQMWKKPEIHLHINPRFEDHNCVVFNARLRGIWGYEERRTRCCFQPGRPFSLIIRIEDDRYRAIVNGSVLASIDHRARPSEINSIYISGDVDVTSIGYNLNLTSFQPKEPTEGAIEDEIDWVDVHPDVSIHPTDTPPLITPENSDDVHFIPGVVEQIISSALVEKGNTLLDSYREGSRPVMGQENVFPIRRQSSSYLESIGTKAHVSKTGTLQVERTIPPVPKVDTVALLKSEKKISVIAVPTTAAATTDLQNGPPALQESEVTSEATSHAANTKDEESPHNEAKESSFVSEYIILERTNVSSHELPDEKKQKTPNKVTFKDESDSDTEESKQSKEDKNSTGS